MKVFASRGIGAVSKLSKRVCVKLHGRKKVLTLPQAVLWTYGRIEPVLAEDTFETFPHIDRPHIRQVFDEMVNEGLLVVGEGNDEISAIFDIFSKSVLTSSVKVFLPRGMSTIEKQIYSWLSSAGIKLTMAEIVRCMELNLFINANLCKPSHRQTLVEAIYSKELVGDGKLEAAMLGSSLLESAVQALRRLYSIGLVYLC